MGWDCCFCLLDFSLLFYFVFGVSEEAMEALSYVRNSEWRWWKGDPASVTTGSTDGTNVRKFIHQLKAVATGLQVVGPLDDFVVACEVVRRYSMMHTPHGTNWSF